MKKIILILFALPVTFLLKAQAPFPDAEDIKHFLASKTCFVLEDDLFSEYNTFIKSAVAENWELTPFEIISDADFNTKRSDPAYSFVVLTGTSFDKDKSGSVFTFINLLIGKDVAELEEMPEFCAVPLSFSEDEDSGYGYKLGVILTFMQQHAKNIAANPSLTGLRYLKYYNKNIPEINGKTILAKAEDMEESINTPDEIKEIYSNDLRLVDEDEMVQALADKTPGTLILHKVGPVGEDEKGYCFKLLIGADDAVIYFYGQHLVDSKNPNSFLPSDLKRLARF